MDLRKSFSKVVKFLIPTVDSGTFWGWSLPGQWNKKQLLLQYARYAYVAISAIAEESAKIDFKVVRNEKELVSHPFLRLIKKPNPMQSQFQFLEFHFTFMKLMGESYWYLARKEKSKKIGELYLLRPDLMEVIVDKDSDRGEIKEYRLDIGRGKKETFEPKDIIHFKMPNPIDPYYGLGTIQAAKIYVETEEFSSTFTRNSIYNSGRPSGILGIQGRMGDAEFRELQKQYELKYSGNKNAGKTMFLRNTDGLSYQKLGMELGEVGLKELKDMSRDDIMIMFRVSKTMLGITDDVNRANSVEMRAVFTENVIKPELDRFIDHINAFLMPEFGFDGAVLSYKDPKQTGLEEKTLLVKAGTETYSMTTNEKRDVLGLEPIKGGDVIPMPINLIPIEVPPTKKSKKIKKAKKIKKKEINRFEAFKQVFFKNQEIWEDKYKKELQKEFNTQLKEILANNKASFTNWQFNLDASRARIIGTFAPLGIELMKQAAAFAFAVTDDPEAELIVTPAIREYIGDRVERFATNTNDQTIKAIEETIASGVADGESIGQLKNRIKEVYAYANDVRAEMIARTETLAASNEGALAAYRQSPAVTAKEWSAEGDACEWCLALDGQVFSLGEDFVTNGTSLEGVDENGKPTGNVFVANYEDIEHPPLHPNCRCSLLPVAAN